VHVFAKLAKWILKRPPFGSLPSFWLIKLNFTGQKIVGHQFGGKKFALEENDKLDGPSTPSVSTCPAI